MISALVSRLCGPGSRPGQGHCVVFGRDNLLSQCLSQPRCINAVETCFINSNVCRFFLIFFTFLLLSGPFGDMRPFMASDMTCNNCLLLRND